MSWYQRMKKPPKTLEGPWVEVPRPGEEDLNETPPLKTNSLQDVSAPHGGFLLTATPHANGGVSLTAAVLSESWDATGAYSKRVITVPINQSPIMKLGTYIEFVTPVTIAGTPSIIRLTIGTPPKSFLTRLVHRLRRNKA